jgi:hypothetical protein
MVKINLIQLAGYAASLMTVVLWLILIYRNPYFNGFDKISITITLSMLVLPALVVAIGLFFKRSLLVLIGFIWSFPYSLYMLLTPGIFLLFGVTNLLYVCCFIVLRINKVRY